MRGGCRLGAWIFGWGAICGWFWYPAGEGSGRRRSRLKRGRDFSLIYLLKIVSDGWGQVQNLSQLCKKAVHVVEGVKAVKFLGAVGEMGGAGGEPGGDGAGCGVSGGQDFPDFWDELFAVAKGQHGGNKGGALYIGDGGAGAQGELRLERGSGAGTQGERQLGRDGCTGLG